MTAQVEKLIRDTAFSQKALVEALSTAPFSSSADKPLSKTMNLHQSQGSFFGAARAQP